MTAAKATLAGLRGGAQPLVKGFALMIAVGGDQGGHVKSPPHGGPSPADGATALPGATFPRMWGQTGQGGDLTPMEGAAFGQLGQDAPGGDGAHAGNGCKLWGALIQRGGLGAEGFGAGFRFVPRRLPGSGARRAPSGCWLCRRWATRISKTWARRRTSSVGFGALALGAGKVADPTRVQDADGNACWMQGGDAVAFMAAGGFAEEVGVWMPGPQLDQTAVAGGGVGKSCKRPARWRWRLSLAMSKPAWIVVRVFGLIPANASEPWWAAQSTVRV